MAEMNNHKEACKNYYEKNKEYLTRKVKCHCGKIFNLNAWSLHKKTKKHLEASKAYFGEEGISFPRYWCKTI